MRSPFLVAAALAALLPQVTIRAQEPLPPANTSEQQKLLAEFLAADDRTGNGHLARWQIVERFDRLPAPRPAQLADFQKRIQKAWLQGRTLERSGDQWFWDNSRQRRRPNEPIVRRGRYLVGGNTQRPNGLLIALHGGGAGAGDAGEAAGAWQDAAKKHDLLLLAPEVLEKTEHGWTDAGTEEFVVDLLDAALRTFKVDPDRVYLAGHSMGGYGSWMLGAHHADRVAAIAPSAGAPTPILGRNDQAIDIVEGVIPNLRNVLVAVYQSRDDRQVPPGPNQCAVRLLGEARKRWGGFAFDYWEVDGRGHGAPEGGHAAHLDRIAGHARNPVPERLVWQPVLPWKRQFHWLYWRLPSPQATLVADLDRTTNTVAITCDKSTQDLWVLLDPRLLDLQKEVVVTVNGAETFRGVPGPSLGTLLLTSGQPDPALQFTTRVPAFRQGS